MALPVVDLAPFFAVGDADDAGRARGVPGHRVLPRGEPRRAARAHGARPRAVGGVLCAAGRGEGQGVARRGRLRRAAPGGVRAAAGALRRQERVPAPLQPQARAQPLPRRACRIQDILSECMGLPPGFLAGYNADRGFDFLTALRYFPATSSDENNGISAHEDGNCITFVLQDGVGGLEVLGEDGRWVPAEPVEGSIVVNVGDVLQVLSNKKFKSATHRVVRRPGAHRHSIAFFLNLHGDKWVEPLPAFAADVGEPPRYRGFRYDEYMQLRMRNKTHPPSRPEDVIHITHYEI